MKEKEKEKAMALGSLRASATEDIDHNKVRVTLWITAAIGLLLAVILIVVLLLSGRTASEQYEKLTVLPSASGGSVGKDSISNLSLQGVLMSGTDKGVAVLSVSGETIVIGLGEPVGSTGWILEKMTLDSVTLSGNGKTTVLTLSASNAIASKGEAK